MKNAILFLILILSFLTGCSDEPHTMAIDSRFSDDEVALIDSCMKEWVEATDSNYAIIFFLHGVEIPLPFTIDTWSNDLEHSIIFKGDSSDPAVEELVKELKRKFFGLHGSENDNILLVTDLIIQQGDDIYKETVLHELGHFYGLEHNAGGIMKENAGGIAPCIYESDLEQFCEVNGCGPNAHSTCF